MGYSLWLNGGEDDVIRIANDHCPRPAAAGCVDEHAFISRFLDRPFDWSRLRADDRHDAVGRDDVAKADVDEPDLHGKLAQLCQECADLSLPQSLNTTAFVNADLVHDLTAGHFAHLGEGLEQVGDAHLPDHFVFDLVEDLSKSHFTLF